MTINDNSTKSINAAIIDLQNQIKQLQHKIGILSKNQLKEDDIEFPGKVEYADEAGKAKEADHAKTADTAKYASETENAVHAGYADNATKATQDGSGNVITDTYATKTALSSGLAGKSDTGHTHTKSQITDFPKTVKFADYKTESLTFSSLTDQKKIELANFGKDVTEDNVLCFMVIYWSGIHIIAQADWAKSQGTGSIGLSCALHSLNNGTGYCVIRCVYLV